MGQDSLYSSLVNFKLKVFVAIISCIAQSIKYCDNISQIMSFYISSLKINI